MINSVEDCLSESYRVYNNTSYNTPGRTTVLGFSLPKEHLPVSRLDSDLELEVLSSGYLRLWAMKTIIELNTEFFIQSYIPNGLAIGDNGGGGFLVYVFGSDDISLKFIRVSDLDPDELIDISPDLHGLLTRDMGLDVYLDMV